jgi:hypothetical protein
LDEGKQTVESQSPHGIIGIEGLGDGKKCDLLLFEEFEELSEVNQ